MYLFEHVPLLRASWLAISNQRSLVISKTLPLHFSQSHTVSQPQHKREYLHIFDQVDVVKVRLEDIRKSFQVEPHPHFKVLLDEVDLPVQISRFLVEVLAHSVEGGFECQYVLVDISEVAVFEIGEFEVGCWADCYIHQIANVVPLRAEKKVSHKLKDTSDVVFGVKQASHRQVYH